MSTTSNQPQGDDGLSESDQQWWDRLAGKTVAVTDPQAVREADELRTVLLRIQAQQQAADEAAEAADPGAEERKSQQLLFEARRRGLLRAEARAAPPQRRLWLGGMAAAVVAGVLFVFQLNRGDDDNEFKVMGGAPVQVVAADQPHQRAQAIADELKAAGMIVRLHPGKKTVVLEIDVPPEQFDSLKPILEKAGIVARPGQVFVRVVGR